MTFTLPDKLVQVVRPEDWPVAGQVVKVVHDHRHKQVEDEEAAYDEETDEVNIGEVVAAPLPARVWNSWKSKKTQLRWIIVLLFGICQFVVKICFF